MSTPDWRKPASPTASMNFDDIWLVAGELFIIIEVLECIAVPWMIRGYVSATGTRVGHTSMGVRVDMDVGDE